MAKGNIIIPIDEIWELTNKPWRFFDYLYTQVEKLTCGEYEYLSFTKEEKKDILKRISKLSDLSGKGLLRK